MEAFQSSSLQNFKRFSFLLFSMHFIFELNQMFPCFAELIMCLRASPSHLAEGPRNDIVPGSIVGSTKTLPHYCPFLVKSTLLKNPIGPCIEVHDVKLNISIVGRWLCISIVWRWLCISVVGRSLCIWEKSRSSSGILMVLPTLIVTMANIRSRNWKSEEGRGKKIQRRRNNSKRMCFMSLKIQFLEMGKTIKLSCSA